MSKLIDNITNVIAYGFYPAYVSIQSIENNNIVDKLINYFFRTKSYENEFFRFEIKDNKIYYEILNEYEPEVILYNKLLKTNKKTYEFDIVDNKFYTDGKINYRHLLMLNDFTDFDLEVNTLSQFEFDSFLNDIKTLVMKYSESELIDFVKTTHYKTQSHNYKYNINVKSAPPYSLDLKSIDGFNPKIVRYQQADIELIDSQIINRVWYTRDACMSAPANLFCCKATLYSCLIDTKLYVTDITQIKSFFGIIQIKPYNMLPKCEGGMEFHHLKFTHWNKLIASIDGIYYRPYFELIGHTEYHSTYIPIHDLIMFCKVLEKEGANVIYSFSYTFLSEK